MTTEMKARPANDRRAQPIVAIVLAASLLIVVAFQTALTLGASFGAAAMGGTHPGRLPDALRLVTGAAALIWFFAALVVLARGGRALVPVPDNVARVATWLLVGLLGLGSLMNFASSSPWERFGWAPYTFVMFALGLVLARSGPPRHRAPRQET